LSLEDTKVKESLIKIATPEIIEISQVHPSATNLTWENAEEDRIYQAAIKRQQDRISEIQKQEANIARSRTEDILHAKGWTRFPRPNERFYKTSICPYGCQSEISYLTDTSPNVGNEDFDKSIPLVPKTTEYGSQVIRHNCVTSSTNNIKYLISRLENAEDTIRDLRNQLNKHAQDSTRHRGMFG